VSRHVLLVDDEPALRTAVGRMLRTLGYEVVMAGDGDEALTAFRAAPENFAFVMLDLSMPRVGGREVLGGLRETAPGVRVLLGSGAECPKDLLTSAQTLFVRKPYGLTELREAVARLTA
jgi:CheY-like chemotaxis protein